MPFYRFFFWGRVPRIDYRKKVNQLILTSLLEDLVYIHVFLFIVVKCEIRTYLLNSINVCSPSNVNQVKPGLFWAWRTSLHVPPERAEAEARATPSYVIDLEGELVCRTRPRSLRAKRPGFRCALGPRPSNGTTPGGMN